MSEDLIKRLRNDDDLSARTEAADLIERLTSRPGEDAVERARYLSDRFEWAAPGDQQEDAWLVRFCDNDVRDMIFTGPEAEQEAWAAWERHSPGYNMYVFRLAALSPDPQKEALVEALTEAVQILEILPYGDWPGKNYPGKVAAANGLIRRAKNALSSTLSGGR